MVDTRKIAQSLGKTAKNTNAIKPQLGDRPDIYTYLRTRYERFTVMEITSDVYTRSIAGDTLIWGNTVFGIWNSFKWGNSATTSFVLGNSLAGVLGTSLLGSNASSYVAASIVNPLNTYIERFNTSTFSDGTTTADWAVTPGQCDFTTGEIAVSEIIALNNETYTTATLTAQGTNLTNLTFAVRFDGSNWESITRGSTLTVANPSALGIEWKATASGTATLTRVKIIYST